MPVHRNQEMNSLSQNHKTQLPSELLSREDKLEHCNVWQERQEGVG